MHCSTRLLPRLAPGGMLVLPCGAGLCSATDLNTATEAELDSIRGIGPATSRRILAERDKSSFRDWADLMARVKGIQQATAQRYTEQGVTVNGLPFFPAPAPVTTPPAAQ